MVPLNTEMKQPPEALIAGVVVQGLVTLALFEVAHLANGQGTCRGALCGLIGTGAFKYVLLIAGLGVMAYTALSSLNFSFQLSSRNIIINSGVVVRDSRTIDFGKIQNVEMQRGPLQMLLGLTKVKIWTASMDQISFNQNGTSTARPDGLLTVYSEDAEAIRDRLVGRDG